MSDWRMPLSMLLLLAVLPPGRAGATPVTVCEELHTTIAHPAEYVQEKVKKHGLKCLFLPHCCTPAWVASPECYVVKKVKKKDAWNEVKNTFRCKPEPMTPEQAFSHFLANLAHPVPGFGIIPGDLTTVFGAYVSAAYETASPLPADVRGELSKLVASRQVPFSAADVADARMLPSSHVLARRLWPSSAIQRKTGGAKGAITYYRLIIYDPRASIGTGNLCVRTANWAHELVHVQQFRTLGWEGFLARYLAEGVRGGYENISFEKDAYYVGNRLAAACPATSLRPAMLQGEVERPPVLVPPPSSTAPTRHER